MDLLVGQIRHEMHETHKPSNAAKTKRQTTTSLDENNNDRNPSLR